MDVISECFGCPLISGKNKFFASGVKFQLKIYSGPLAKDDF